MSTRQLHFPMWMGSSRVQKKLLLLSTWKTAAGRNSTTRSSFRAHWNTPTSSRSKAIRPQALKTDSPINYLLSSTANMSSLILSKKLMDSRKISEDSFSPRISYRLLNTYISREYVTETSNWRTFLSERISSYALQTSVTLPRLFVHKLGRKKSTKNRSVQNTTLHQRSNAEFHIEASPLTFSR